MAAQQFRGDYGGHLLHAALPHGRRRQLRAAFPQHLVAAPGRQDLQQRPGAAAGQLQPGDALLIQAGAGLRRRLGAMGHQGGASGLIPELGAGREVQAAAEHHPQRLRLAQAAAGEQGIVGAHGAAADNHRIAAGPQPVDPAAGGRAADPQAGSVAEGGAAIGTHGPLEDPQGPAAGDAVAEGPVEGAGLSFRHAADHLDAGGRQLGQPAASHLGIGIGHGHHHPGQPGGDHGLAAGRRAAVVAAGLQGHHQGAAAGPFARLGQGADLGVGLAGAGVVPLSHQRAAGIEHHRPHQGVGAGAAGAQFS